MGGGPGKRRSADLRGSVISGWRASSFPQREGPGALDEGLEEHGENQEGSGGRGGRLEPVYRLPLLPLRHWHHRGGEGDVVRGLQGRVPRRWWGPGLRASRAGLAVPTRPLAARGLASAAETGLGSSAAPDHSPRRLFQLSLSKQSANSSLCTCPVAPGGARTWRPALTRTHPGFSASRSGGHPPLRDGSGDGAEWRSQPPAFIF